jgi:putative hydrolase of the HAD superfamily
LLVLFFDLDNTLYSPSLGVITRVDARINAFMIERLRIGEAEVDAMRRRYWAEHGTTLRGLMAQYQVEPDDYLRFVHDLDLSDVVRRDDGLREMLSRMPCRKAVFTNAPRTHATAVLDLLGVADSFEAVVCLEDLGYVPKPVAEAYAVALRRVGVEGGASALVEDTRANLGPAKRLGMKTIWVTDSATHDPDVDHVIARIHDVEAIAELQ